MNESTYKSALSHLKTSENFEEKTCQLLITKIIHQKSNVNNKENTIMDRLKKKSMIKWGTGLAVCAAFTLCVVSIMQHNITDTTIPSVSDSPAVHAKVMVNIEGTITAVGEDGKSFQVGDLWVTITKDTKFGSTEPTAPDVEDQLVSEDFAVGNIVAGYTSEDVSTGKVNATVIYNNFPANQ